MACDPPSKLTYKHISQAFAKVKGKFETDNGTLSIIPEARYEEACTIIRDHFIPDEPLCNAFNIQWNTELKERARKYLSENMSVMMVSKDTDEVMGVQITGRMKKTDDNQAILSRISYEPLRDLLTFLTHKDKEVNFYEKFNVNEAMHFSALGVHREFRRIGLGMKLIGTSVALGRELGFKVIKAEGTSNFSQRIFIKYGFENLCEMPYDKYIYKGRSIRGGTLEHTMTKVFALKVTGV